MDKQTAIIHSRNKLMIKLLFTCFVISLVINAFIDPAIIKIIAPIGIGLFGVLLYLSTSMKYVTQTMYSVIVVIYVYFIFLIVYEPLLINFIFLWFALISSSIYHKAGPIIVSGILTIGSISYFFFRYKSIMFPTLAQIDVVYFLLFTVLVMLFFIVSSRNTEKLRIQAEKQEEQATNMLWQTKEYLESLFDHMTDCVVIHDVSGQIIMVNHSFSELYGWREEEIMNKQIPIVTGENQKILYEMWENVCAGIEEKEVEIVCICKDGSLVDVVLSVTPIRDKTGIVVALATLTRDITEKNKTDELIRRSDKLSVVSQLAAGVAHEIRNPLTVISGFLQVMNKQKREETSHIQIMLSEIERINVIISEFLLLAKPQVEKMEKVNLQTIIEEVLTLLNTSAIMKNVLITSSYEINAPIIQGEKNQIKQVLINILKNAMEAMESGGRVQVILTKPQNGEVSIRVIDNGIGIEESKFKKLGEPFFTTKEQGTGLGLMISHKIIEFHKGSITFNSKVGKGTTVDVRLPLVVE
ncbi:ATP-binding protein [Alkalihalobacillus sp. LMS39]|uniref:ATP-binding protein n=1 Tax=Alkalihalobacillus sp. LMS39 TaxID=2924032 RepID=UPI001FB5371A|nr:ATP-binding protein [Alkalihalobacillus sp. LMS39]UOE94003.1 ATP-binding protein [Alkalihalobacillus sp. LMS39]